MSWLVIQLPGAERENGTAYHDSGSRRTLALFRCCTVLSAPAVPDIRTARLLTHGMQP